MLRYLSLELLNTARLVSMVMLYMHFVFRDWYVGGTAALRKNIFRPVFCACDYLVKAILSIGCWYYIRIPDTIFPLSLQFHCYCGQCSLHFNLCPTYSNHSQGSQNQQHFSCTKCYQSMFNLGLCSVTLKCSRLKTYHLH